MFGVTKRTRFVTTLIVIAVICVLAGILLGYVGVFGLRSELCEVTATSDKAGDAFGGVGVNCDLIPNVNLVRDASFESSTDYASMLIVGASDGSVYLSPDVVAAAGYNTNACSGDMARVISIDSEGVMSEKFTGVVTGFKPARLGVITPVKDAKDLWDEDRIKDMTFYGNMALALTEKGKIIYDVTNSQLTGVVNSNGKFSKIEANDTGVIAASSDGSIFISQDGKNFNLVYEPDFASAEICGIGSVGSSFAVCYRNGTIVTVVNGKTAESRLPQTKATAFVSDGKKFLAVDNNGNIYSSSNGMVFELIDNSEWLNGQTKILTCSTEGICCFVVDNSKAVIVRTDRNDFEIEKIEMSKDMGARVNSVDVTASGLIITGTSDKKAFAIDLNTGNTTALSSENVLIESIIGVSGDKVFFDSGKEVFRSQILSELSIAGNMEGVDIIADDILIAGHTKKAAGGAISASDNDGDSWDITADSVWNVYGRGTTVIATDRSNTGKNGARLSGSGTGVHAITQDLPGKAKDDFVPGTFYRLSLYAMSDNAPDKVYCWIEGEGFGRCGFELTQLGDNYKRFSSVFAVTDQMADAGEIRLSIGFEGTGHILIDDLYLGPDSYDTAGIPEFYAGALTAGKPAAIRLNNLNIGSDGFAETSLYLMSQDSVSHSLTGTSGRAVYSSDEGTTVATDQMQSVTCSLEDSLRLVKQCNSSPWLVIGPYVNQSDIDKLLEYLCGSLTSEYGGRRIDNGTALPWSRQFTRFYIEINDNGRMFQSDIQKAAYVNYVMSMFTQSEYFSDIKDKAVFLDGMKYDGGTMMSDADNHTMAVELTSSGSSSTFIEEIDSSYVLAQYDTPHVVNGSFGGEYIRTLETDGSDCGRILTAIMTSEADFAEMFLFDAAVNFVPSTYTDEEMFVGNDQFINMMTVSGLTTAFTGYDELYIDLKEPLDASAPVNVEQFVSNVTTACFSNGSKTYIVIANPSDTQQSFLINDNKLGRTDSVFRRYDSKGRMINERKVKYERLRHILQPGEFVIVEITAKT